MRIGIIGPGSIADNHLAPAIKAAGLTLHSVLSRDRARAEAFAAKHGASVAHDRLDQMLADPSLDAVVIASPDKLHAAQAIAAARAAKHILCEKPMATSVADANAMVEAARDAGVVLGVAYHLRWHLGHRALVERLRSGALGALHHVRVQWTYEARDASNWRAHAEVGKWWGLAGVGTHCVDLVRWIAGEEVDAAAGVIGQPRWKAGHDENAVVGLRFASGATAEILTSVLFKSPRRVEIYCARGTAICDETLGPHGGGTITVDGATLMFAQADPYAGELADFARAVRERGRCEVDGEEGLRNVEILTRVAG
ncbi:MAG TPA: Gfo/Idh/MocA family oxidoreductase [Kofleriaceae bacterium]|nr:Gfo/Idh/MocA family oxidoreductase [Kofleriaceae bacterium]